VLFRAEKAGEELFKTMLLDTLRLTALVEFLTNVYVFPLCVEAIMTPVMFFAWVTLSYVQATGEQEAVQRLLERFVILIGAVVIVVSVVHAALDWSNFATGETLRAFFATPLLTIALLPFIYIVGLRMAYEVLFVRVGFALRDSDAEPTPPRDVRLTILRCCGLNLARVNRFASDVVPRMFSATSKSEAQRMIKAFRY
jgi:hypothetical protein